MTGMSSSAFADPLEVTVDSGFQQREGANVTVKNAGGTTVAQGTTVRPPGGGRPKFTQSLPPGVYTIEASWLNSQGKTETGTMTYTVTTGKNKPNVVVSEAGNPNQTGSGTSATANGVTPTGTADAGSQTNFTPRIGGFRASLDAGAAAHFGDGINTLAQFTGGNPDGVNLLEADADTIGSSTGGTIGYRINMPETAGGPDRAFVGLGGRSIWARSVTRIGMIQAPGGSNFEVPGLNTLANIASTQVDDVEARTEIDELEFNMRMGLIYSLGPVGATLGNLMFGNLGPADRNRQNRFQLALIGDLFYRSRTREDDLTFTNAGDANRYDSEIETDEFGLRFRPMVKGPILPGVSLKIGPEFGVYRSSDDLSATQIRGSNTDSFSSSDDKLGYEIGFYTSLSAKIGPGRLTGYANFKHRSDTAILKLPGSNSEDTRIDYSGSQQVTGGVRYRIPLDQLVASDIRLKTDIVCLGALPSGLPVYSYKYIWSPETHIGVMAQEAHQMFPEAVHKVGGFLAVDYAKIR